MFIVHPNPPRSSPVGAACFSPSPPLPPAITCRPYGAWEDIFGAVSINMPLLRSWVFLLRVPRLIPDSPQRIRADLPHIHVRVRQKTLNHVCEADGIRAH